MLLIITSTGDRLFGFINIDDLERPLTLKMLILSDLLAIFGCKRVNCDEMDGDRLRYLRTGTAIGFRASHELCSNFLLFLLTSSPRQREID